MYICFRIEKRHETTSFRFRKFNFVIHKIRLMKNSLNSNCQLLNPAVTIIFALLLSFTGIAHASQLKNNQQVSDLLANQNIQNSIGDTVYNFVEKMPEFPGGEKEVVKFLSKTMVYPEKARKKDEHGKVIVQFVVSKTGKVENAKVLKGVSKELDAEALRVINLLPDWTPGEQNGEKVAVYRIIPILFQNTPPEEAWKITDKTLVVIDNVKMPANFNVAILNIDKFATVTVLKPFPAKERSRIMSKYGRQAENGVILLTSNKTEIRYALPDSVLNPTLTKDTTCKEDIILPMYPGGEEKLLSYIADSIQYPFVAQRTKTEGKVFVRFMVDTKGKVSDVSLVRHVDYFLDKEALRIMNILPDWTPGAKCDTKLNFLVTVPVTFKLNLPATEKKEWVKNDKTIMLFDNERLPSSFQLEWLRYENLASYQVLQPTTKEVTKKLVSQYGRDAANGVIVITSRK